MDSSDEYKGESDSNSDSEASNKKKKSEEEPGAPGSQLELSPDKPLCISVKKDSDLLMAALQPVVKLSDISPLKAALTDPKSGTDSILII